MSALTRTQRALVILAMALPAALAAADPPPGDAYDAAVMHPGRPARDLKRDPI